MTDERLPDQPSIEDLTPLLRINRLCDEFRRAWKDGGPPRLEDYLGQVSEGTRESLLRNLLPLDIEFRRRKQNESPSSDDYIIRFPEHAKLIRQAFFESTMASFHREVSTPSVAATVSLIPVAKRLGDYELLGELGKGGFGVVYEARHVKRGDRVALKTLPLEADSHDLHTPATKEQKRKTGDRLMRFKREFRMLADMNHPNLVGLHSLEADGDQWFFTMDLIEGTDFVDYVRPGGELDEARLRAALPQLVAGVMALHSRNVIHRDLKPSNVMVSNEGRVTILDFGLVAELENRSHTASIAGFAGTPAYAAPEQLFGKHTVASDWYSVGTILYESIAETRPFQGYGAEVLRDKQEHAAPPMEAQVSVPADLCLLAMQLLEREPDNRPDALAITHAVAADVAAEVPSVTGSVGQLIGREPHLAQLQAVLDRVKQSGQAECVFVSGRSGEGKTSLVEHFLEPLRKDRKFVVLSGRCYDRETVPFKAIDGVIDELCRFLQSLTDADAALLLPDDLPFLLQLFPVLNRVEVISRREKSDVSKMDKSQVRHRAFAALGVLLKRISQNATVVLFADDLQWGDADSAQGLFSILSSNATSPLLFVGTYRSDEVNKSQFLLSWRSELSEGANESDISTRQVCLAPLSLGECTQLLIDRLQRDDEQTRRRAAEFHQKTAGNPYLLVELVACFDPYSDSFEALSLPELISRKLSRLPSEAKRLLEVIAVSGKALQLEEACKAAGQETAAAGTLVHMRSENLVRLFGSDDALSVDTYHDKIRESVLEHLPDKARIELHRSLARQIENTEGLDCKAVVHSFYAGTDSSTFIPRAADLAYHYDSAGDDQLAMVYAVYAAEAARKQFAFDNAVEEYQIALGQLGQCSTAVKLRIVAGLGKSLAQIGRYDDALEVLKGAVAYAETTIQKARVEFLQAEILHRQDRLDESVNLYHKVFARNGMKVPPSRAGVQWQKLRNQSVFLIQMALPMDWIRRAKSFGEKDQFWMSVRAAYGQPIYWREPLRAVQNVLALANSTRGIRDPNATMLHVYARFQSYLILGWMRGAMRSNLDFDSPDLWKGGDATKVAMFCRNGALTKMGVADLAGCKRLLEKAEEILTGRVQDFYQLAVVRSWHASALLLLGQLDASARKAREVFEATVKGGQNRFAQQTLAVLTASCHGRLPFDQLRDCFKPVVEDLPGTMMLMGAQARWHLACGRAQPARQVAEEMIAIWDKEDWLHPPCSEIPSIYIRSLREYALAIDTSDTQAARRIRGMALSRVRRIEERSIMAIGFPSQHREIALVLGDMGKLRRALKHARRSCEIAKLQGARYELAQSRLVVAELSKKLNLPDSDRLIEEAKEGMVEFEQMIEANAAMWERKEEDA